MKTLLFILFFGIFCSMQAMRSQPIFLWNPQKVTMPQWQSFVLEWGAYNYDNKTSEIQKIYYNAIELVAQKITMQMTCDKKDELITNSTNKKGVKIGVEIENTCYIARKEAFENLMVLFKPLTEIAKFSKNRSSQFINMVPKILKKPS